MIGRLISRRLLAASLVAAAAVSAASAQEPAIPDTPAGRQLAGWLEAFNSGDPARFEAFLRAEYPSAPVRPGADAQFRQQTGGFDLDEIASADETVIAAIVHERIWTDSSARLVLAVEAEPPHDIASLSIRRAPSAVTRVSEAEAFDQLKARLDAMAENDQFSGAVLIARNGQPVFDYVSGQADRENGVANTLDTRFRNGSMNKMFTAVAILQLVEAGRIRLDAPVGEYLTDYPNTDLASRVTVEQLLTHTGGTGNIFTPEYFERRLETRTHADYVALFGARSLKFEPGGQYEYSNYGFVLLGAVVEAVSGQSYYEYVDEHIFAPAGMTSTGALPEDVDVPGRAVAYTAMDGTPRPATDTLPYRGTAAGGGYSTVADFVRFAEALKGGVLLSPEMVEAATTMQVAALPAGGYGYGFAVSETNGVRSFGHSGFAPGMAAELRLLPDSGYAIAVASNMDSPMVQRIVEFVGARLPAEP